ncbi:RNA 2',3'-cyclic phosphodiesterase [Candidatus Pacearchaeota archaeon]|nr:RNA 2',3'-cyclic phosphodiesterase [Candidatus Pacearchaeota archaeon]
MRVFIAIDFPDEVIKEIALAQELLGKRKFTGKITELENLHLTLKFLGEIDEKKIEKVRGLLREIKFNEMQLKLGDIGLFNYNRNPRIVWVKVQGKALYELQKKIDIALKGIFPEEERFMGHLTIARIKYVMDKKGFSDSISSIHIKPLEFKCKSFKLMRSDLKPLGPVYSVLEEFSSDENS